MGLKEELRKLIELQEIDSRIYTLNQKKDIEKPQELERLKEEFSKEKSKLAEVEEELKKVQVKRKDKELELASKEENIRKAQGQLYQLKTNKEYQAKLQEIESLKADVSVLEEEILKIFDEVDQVQKRLNEVKESIAQKEKTFKEEEAKINREIKEIEIEIKNLTDKRSMLAKNVDSNILAIYDRLIETRGGVAIAPVEHENCGACHMRVTAQKINEIKMYKNLVYCESCVRILYVKDDLE